ncbi:hypothetical protein PSPO01_05548 [Paraphaeosphaeria sporulosa]
MNTPEAFGGRNVYHSRTLQQGRSDVHPCVCNTSSRVVITGGMENLLPTSYDDATIYKIDHAGRVSREIFQVCAKSEIRATSS